MMERPQALYLLLALPFLALAWRLSFIRGKKAVYELGGKWRFGRLADAYLFKSFFSFLFFALFFAAAVMALGGWRWGERLVPERRTEQEVVILLDISRSMLAQDEPPSRLGKAVAVIRRVLQQLEAARVAVVVFRGQALKAVPLTEDPYVLETFLSYVQPGMLTSPGTDLQKGIEASLKAFSENRGPNRALLLFSDGEYQTGNPAAAASTAGREGIPILVAALGSQQGAQVQLPDGQPLLDEQGEPVITRLRLETLRKVADLSGGELLPAGPKAEDTAARLLAALKGQREAERATGLRREKKQRYRLFLSAGLLFLCFHVLQRAIRWKNTL